MVRIPPLAPAEAGTRFSDPGEMQGRVDLCYVKVDQTGIEPATCKSQVQCPTAKPLFTADQFYGPNVTYDAVYNRLISKPFIATFGYNILWI